MINKLTAAIKESNKRKVKLALKDTQRVTCCTFSPRLYLKLSFESGRCLKNDQHLGDFGNTTLESSFQILLAYDLLLRRRLFPVWKDFVVC